MPRSAWMRESGLEPRAIAAAGRPHRASRSAPTVYISGVATSQRPWPEATTVTPMVPIMPTILPGCPMLSCLNPTACTMRERILRIQFQTAYCEHATCQCVFLQPIPNTRQYVSGPESYQAVPYLVSTVMPISFRKPVGNIPPAQTITP